MGEHIPDWVREVEVEIDPRSVGRKEAQAHIGWNAPGMEAVAEIVTENPELSATIQELQDNVLAKNTLRNYQTAITRYQDFCATVGYDRSIITEETVLHYIGNLRKQKATIGVIDRVKPALQLMIEMYTGKDAVFTPRKD